MNRKKLATFALAAAVVAPVVACTTVGPGETAVMVDSFGAPTVSGCQGPETFEFTPMSDAVKYPSRQISWDATGAEGAEAPPTRVTSNAAEPAELDVPYVITFDLTADCDELIEFHREFGTKYPDWHSLLRYVVGQPAENTVVSIAQKYTWAEIWNDDAKRVEFQKALTDTLPKATAARTNGKEFFKNFQVTVMKPVLLNDGLKNAIDIKQQAIAQAEADKARKVADAEAAEAAAKAREAQARAEKATAEAEAAKKREELSGYPNFDDYLREKAVEKGITPWPAPIIAGAPAR
ncbi:hypothetical protein SEQ_HALENA_48 [Mycobacterium phage Halena]|uniref:Band 7 domain-containing protein n=3 Tax=Bronvirus TaxID=1623278 RepID=A0A482JE56_9CAUD|nr:band-7-like membrane protein [Mycobacterium phage Silverleaf]ASR86031.1 hypothetical protein SEA_APPLETREE2_48 [Mycobacterium phage Appletree2]AYD82228.1 band-7-like membrane protein [Mycobacterium phage Wamburgrxpress]QBP29832.1 hypothetical protein SEQ_HALENA_48 [Mycobacterium phage Halena]UEM46334.1 band-7-like membrane protein [Mycobacterium phage Enceladus]QBP29134.1 band-7-like membrane protein [Mycobacterium phage Silverleaf]